MITVYGLAPRSNVQAVMWGIGELGLRHRLVERGHGFGGLDTPEFRAMNPHGLVPVIRDGGAGLGELRHPALPGGAVRQRRLLAAGPGGARAGRHVGRVGRPRSGWTSPARSSGPGPHARRPSRDEAALTAALAASTATSRSSRRRIGDGPWLLGADFTVADILVGHQLYRYFTIDIPRTDRPGLAAYYARLCAPAGLRRARHDLLRQPPRSGRLMPGRPDPRIVR